MRRLALAGWLLAACCPAYGATQADDGSGCGAPIAAAERSARLPANLLQAIGLVESGRADPRSGVASPWPWTVNVGGVGTFYESKAEAVAAVVAAQAAGVRSIDVGCMQINLQYHPLAFSRLEDAFDPVLNVRYGAAFLQSLHTATGNWAAAIAAYHSATPDLGQVYTQRVAAVWPLAGLYALPLPAAGTGKAAPPPQPDVDPFHVATPEFRARLLREAAFRRSRDRELGLLPVQPASSLPRPLPPARALTEVTERLRR